MEKCMNKDKILNQINKLIEEGKTLLGTKHFSSGIMGDFCYVNDEHFTSWKCQIKIFLASTTLFENVYNEFTKDMHMYTNFNYTNRYISLLKGLKNSIEDGIIQVENDKSINEEGISGSKAVFIAHGHSKLWNEVLRFLHDDLNISDVNYFEKDSHVGRSIADALSDFRKETNFAIVVMTAEDEMPNNTKRTRQNVIHEIGFFQGKLGFEKVAILKQDGVESFSNIDGIQYIPFSGENISQTFYNLQKMLKREKII